MGAVAGALGLPAEGIAAALQAAATPSRLHDHTACQFRVAGSKIELYVSPQWSCAGREARLACGAALFNLRLALEYAGVRPLVTLLPEGGGSMLLAVVRAGGATTISPQRSALYQAIRATADDAPRGRSVPKEHRWALLRAAQEERGWLYLLDNVERAGLHELTACGREHGRSNACPQAGASDHVLAVLCSFHTGPMAELQAGQALQRIVLTAASVGLTVSCVPGLMETASSRDQVRKVLSGNIAPQTVLCLAYGRCDSARPLGDGRL